MSEKHMFPERMQKLLADQAVQALSSSEKQELQTMLQSVDADTANRFAEELELAAAVLDRTLSAPLEVGQSIPEHMQDKVLKAMSEARKLDRLTTDQEDDSSDLQKLSAMPLPPQQQAANDASGASFGWYAAAASFALALVFGWQLLQIQGTEGPDLNSASQREALLAQEDTMVLPWQPPDSPRFADVRGDVVWDNASQTGYMRLVNMPVNDPSESQYQLWIVDPQRDQHPVDGGVFNVNASGEVIVPINEKLAINQPAAFAITEEQPGGVVVSAGPLLVVASAEQSEQA